MAVSMRNPLRCAVVLEPCPSSKPSVAGLSTAASGLPSKSFIAGRLAARRALQDNIIIKSWFDTDPDSTCALVPKLFLYDFEHRIVFESLLFLQQFAYISQTPVL